VKRFSWILTLPLIVVAVIFAIANRELVILDLWPFELSPQLPLFVILLACIVFGLMVGSLATWLSGAATRQRLRQTRRRMAELEREAARRMAAPAANGQPGLPAPGLPAPGLPAPQPGKRSALGG
jgi:uncharacterized integral membrane protein